VTTDITATDRQEAEALAFAAIGFAAYRKSRPEIFMAARTPSYA
jgi:hypothetical protein